MIRSDTVRKGEIAVQRTILRAIELGCTVCRPCLEGSRYDLVIERRQGVLERVQVKYCDARPGSSGSYALSLTRHTGGRTRRIYPYSAREVDAIVALLASDDMLVWLPAPVWDGRSTLNIRTRPARNGQRSGIRMATDFRW